MVKQNDYTLKVPNLLGIRVFHRYRLIISIKIYLYFKLTYLDSTLVFFCILYKVIVDYTESNL